MEATYFDNERSGLYRRRSAGSVELDEEVQEIVLHPSPLPYQDKKVSERTVYSSLTKKLDIVACL